MSADAWMVADPIGCVVCGLEACEAHAPAPAAEPRPERRLVAQRASAVIDAPAPVAIIESIVWAGCVTTLVAESGVGKTFALLSKAAAVSDGLSWHGRDVTPGSVAYFSYEGDALGSRLRALRDVQRRRLENLYIIRARDPLSPRVARDGEETPSRGETDAREALQTLARDLDAAQLPPIRLGVIDTVRASLTGSEDASEAVSAYLRAIRRLSEIAPAAGWVLSHHAGWQDGDSPRKRERGSSAWRGNCDATVYLEAGTPDPSRGETPLVLRTLKVRDADVPPPLHLVRRRVELDGWDAFGRRLTSCVIDSDQRSHADREAATNALQEAEARAVDARVLRIIAEQPDLSTSQERLRAVLGLRRDVVAASLARLIQRQWVTLPERQRQPYGLTAGGRLALSEAA